MEEKRDAERYCIDDEGHNPIDYYTFVKCDKCGMTWFYVNGDNPTKAEDEIPDQSTIPITHQKH